MMELEQMESGVWYVSDPEFPGAWATGATRELALEEFDSVLKDWKIIESRISGSH